ncbi:MAG: oligoendopeptidase F [Chlamydiia bacterium]|nr:oligoendopeptidase F [Chlamydiia bacterium]
MNAISVRSLIQPEDKWNIETLFPSLSAWDAAFSQVTESVISPFWPKLLSYKGRLHEGILVLKEILEHLICVNRDLEKLYTYAHLRHDEEITINDHKRAFERISSLIHAFSQETAWFEPEVLSLQEDILQGYLDSEILAPYRFYLEKIVHLKSHTLTGDKEELIARVGKSLATPAKTFSALNNADLNLGTVTDSTGKIHPLSHGLYQVYLRSPDRTLRENAFKQMHNTFASFENTLSELINGQVEAHLFSAKTRKYTSCLEAALFPKNIPLAVYKSLIDAVRYGLPALHRYIELRKQALGVEKLHLYDMYAPIVSEVEMKMEYNQGEDLVIESVAPLGEEYQALLCKGLKEQRWVDRYENKHKRSGAYSSGCFDSYPYILMNYRGTLRDVFTLAHEAGHSMHSLLSILTQPFHYSHYPIFVAEVASTFNEELLMHLILKNISNSQEKTFLINEKIEDIRATLFRQTMFAEFELKIHVFAEEGIPITPQLLKEEYYKINEDYFGKNAVIDEEISVEWARIPHFYYNFYVYQYATGISASLSLAEKVLKGNETARAAYLNFLKSGGSRYPIDLLKIAGVDMTSREPVEAAIRHFDGLVTELGICLQNPS